MPWLGITKNALMLSWTQKTQVLALVGSKEGIFNIHRTLLDPGDALARSFLSGL